MWNIEIIDMKRIFTSIVVLLALASCNNQPENTEKSKSTTDSLMEEVMKGHDEGMGKIGKLENTNTLITHKIDSLKKVGNNVLTIRLKQLQNNLSNADSSMEDWMNHFDMEMKGISGEAQQVKYLQENEKRVKGIADSIKSNLSTADSLLQKMK